MTFANAEKVAAWIASLRGMEGTFLYRPRQRLTSTLTGRTIATKAFAYNRALVAQGWAANEVSGLRVGQFLQVGSQLVRLIEAPLLADANGRVTISFEPELRIDYAQGSAINFVNPAGMFSLSSSDDMGYTLNPDRIPTFPTMSAKEAV